MAAKLDKMPSSRKVERSASSAAGHHKNRHRQEQERFRTKIITQAE